MRPTDLFPTSRNTDHPMAEAVREKPSLNLTGDACTTAGASLQHHRRLSFSRSHHREDPDTSEEHKR